MRLIECRFCNKIILDRGLACPQCKMPQNHAVHRLWLWGSIGLLLLLVSYWG